MAVAGFDGVGDGAQEGAVGGVLGGWGGGGVGGGGGGRGECCEGRGDEEGGACGGDYGLRCDTRIASAGVERIEVWGMDTRTL